MTHRIAIQGEAGSFSEAAARKLLPGAGTVGFPTFGEVAAAVAAGAAGWGVLPAENSVVGPVADVERLLEEHDLARVAELSVPVRQCLIAARAVPLTEIREVCSHPVALGQCRRFLADHGWMRPVAVEDTAGAVREVVAAGRPEAAAIAGARAAAIHGAVVLARDIADRADNVTRFVLFRRREA